jgi:hypothetical protein
MVLEMLINVQLASNKEKITGKRLWIDVNNSPLINLHVYVPETFNSFYVYACMSKEIMNDRETEEKPKTASFRTIVKGL